MRLPACRVSAAASLRSSPIVTGLRALHTSRGAAAAAGTTPVDQLRTEYDAIIVGGGELAASLDRGNKWDWVRSKILEVEGQSARGMKKREIQGQQANKCSALYGITSCVQAWLASGQLVFL